jgi:hypothetical protein
LTKLTPEQEALYALDRNLQRSDLSMAAQLEYDRLKPAWDREEITGRNAAAGPERSGGADQMPGVRSRER